jgi:hypothetical protein
MCYPIISVHIPKVAGTSFLHHLRCIYGKDNLCLDYDENPVDTRSVVNLDPACYRINPITTIQPYKVVHGHFHPKKYDSVSNAFRLTFLRHPIDNILSIYRFWSVHSAETWDTPLFRYFKEKKLSIEQFSMLPKIRYLYSEAYFGGYDMGKFNFIGDYKKYDLELNRLGKELNVHFDLSVRMRVTPTRISGGGGMEPPEIHSDTLKRILNQDIEFYECHAGQ